MTDVTVAAMVAHDAHASAAQMGGTVCNSWEEFAAAIAEAEEHRRRAARPVPPEVARMLARQLQRLYDAIWYGTREQVQTGLAELAPTVREWKPQHTVRVEAINPGDFVSVVGVNLYDSTREEVVGEVVATRYTSRWYVDADGQDREVFGFDVELRALLPVGRPAVYWTTFVAEGRSVLRLPRPRRRRRCPAWLAETGQRGEQRA